MIHSMTGYGGAEAELAGGSALRVEVRTLNGRHLSVSASLPRGWEQLRPVVVRTVRERLARGSVSVTVSCEGPAGSGDDMPVLDWERARRYASLLADAQRELGLAGGMSVDALARLPGVFGTGRGSRALPLPDEEGLVRCLGAALDGVLQMRAAEGRRLEQALRESTRRIAVEVEAVARRAPERLVRRRDQLRERVAALAEAVEVDDDRLAREIAYLAEKWDVDEEVARLRAHLDAFVEELDGPGRAKGDKGGEGGAAASPADADAAASPADAGAAASPAATEARRAGKRLGFLVQEMNREAGTVAAKANDLAVGASSMAIREELERLREQLENVE